MRNSTRSIKEITFSNHSEIATIYRQNRMLVTHKKELHSGKPRVQCNLCGQYFTRQQSVKRHIAIVHSGIQQ